MNKAPSESSSKRSVSAEDLLGKELICLLVLVTAFILVAASADAPLETASDAAGRQEAPWIFIGIQMLLGHLPVWAAGLAFPAALLALWAFLPRLDGGPKETARRKAWTGRRGTLIFLSSLALAVAVTLWAYL